MCVYYYFIFLPSKSKQCYLRLFMEGCQFGLFGKAPNSPMYCGVFDCGRDNWEVLS